MDGHVFTCPLAWWPIINIISNAKRSFVIGCFKIVDRGFLYSVSIFSMTSLVCNTISLSFFRTDEISYIPV